MSRRHRLVLAGLAPFFSASTVAPLLAFVSFTSFTAIASAQTTWYVDDDASPDGNGLGWTTAYRYLQDALAEASAGDEIHVAGGIYRPDQDEAGNTIPGDRVATFQLLTGVALSGGYAGLANTTYPDQRDIEAYRSILTGDLDGDDVSRLYAGFT